MTSETAPTHANLIDRLDARSELLLVRVSTPTDPATLDFIPWPITESAVRRVARANGLLLERLRDGSSYRLWDVSCFVDNCSDPFPMELSTHGEYVDTLPGIAAWLWYLPNF